MRRNRTPRQQQPTTTGHPKMFRVCSTDRSSTMFASKRTNLIICLKFLCSGRTVKLIYPSSDSVKKKTNQLNGSCQSLPRVNHRSIQILRCLTTMMVKSRWNLSSSTKTSPFLEIWTDCRCQLISSQSRNRMRVTMKTKKEYFRTWEMGSMEVKLSTGDLQFKTNIN